MIPSRDLVQAAPELTEAEVAQICRLAPGVSVVLTVVISRDLREWKKVCGSVWFSKCWAFLALISINLFDWNWFWKVVWNWLRKLSMSCFFRCLHLEELVLSAFCIESFIGSWVVSRVSFWYILQLLKDDSPTAGTSIEMKLEVWNDGWWSIEDYFQLVKIIVPWWLLSQLIVINVCCGCILVVSGSLLSWLSSWLKWTQMHQMHVPCICTSPCFASQKENPCHLYQCHVQSISRNRLGACLARRGPVEGKPIQAGSGK